MRELSPRESRLIAVGLLILALLLIDLVIVQPLIDGFADRAKQREELLVRYAANNRTIAAIPRLSRQAANRDKQTARYTLVAADAAAASDALRDRVQTAANVAGAEFRGSEDLGAANGMVATRATVRVPAGKITPLITAIENSTPLVTITALSISADDALLTGTAASLDVKIDIAIAFHPSATR